MATFDLGRVTPLYKGDYSASASYELNDVVLYNGNLYWHVQATATVGILPTDTTVWKLAFADEGVRAEIRGYADDAQVSKTAAAQSASQASASASNASASASQAASSAQSAQTAEGNASASASAAATSATNSAASAQSAASSAQTATDKATLATNKAQAASESASLATAKASAAATSETNAAASAQTATAKASEAAASATSAQEYDESAQQSAVNAQTAQGLAETAQTGAETAQGLAEDARDLAQQYAESIDPEHIYSAYPTDTASGAVASFADGADDIPLKSLVVDINPVQSGSGDPSPDNVRPISGWTGANVVACGKNLLNPNFSAYQTNTGYSYMNGVVPEGQTARFTFIDKDTSVDVSGISIGFQEGISLNQNVPTKFNWVMQNGEIQSNVTNVKGGVICSGVFIYPKTEAAFNAMFSRWDIMVELGSTATDYEPYSGQAIPISWQTEAGTVYGGSLDVLTGVLTVDRAGVDMGTLDWSYQAGVDGKIGRFKTENLASTISRKQTVVGRPVNTDLLSSVYSADSDPMYSRTIDFTICSTNSDGAVYALDSRYTSNAAYKEAMDGVMLVYRLATPIEIQLTPHEVKSLLGQNNIFADTGDSSVEYRADTKMYIERLTEPDADMIADANITSGSYFMVGNTLYKATANIASGSTVIVGTNCTQKSLSEALNEINS